MKIELDKICTMKENAKPFELRKKYLTFFLSTSVPCVGGWKEAIACVLGIENVSQRALKSSSTYWNQFEFDNNLIIIQNTHTFNNPFHFIHKSFTVTHR